MCRVGREEGREGEGLNGKERKRVRRRMKYHLAVRHSSDMSQTVRRFGDPVVNRDKRG